MKRSRKSPTFLGKVDPILINSLKIRERIYNRLEINISVDRTETHAFLYANHYKIVEGTYRRDTFKWNDFAYLTGRSS